MLGKCAKLLLCLTLFTALLATTAPAGPPVYDPATGALLQGAQGVAKVKPSPTGAVKVKPYGFGGLGGLNPLSWGEACYLPTPNPKQFVAGPQVFFGRLRGEARRGRGNIGLQVSTVDFDDHLGFRKNGNAFWEFAAHYQFLPRWGLTYKFSPINMEATHTPSEGFNFGGHTFAGGTQVHSKWENYIHRAGLVFNVSQKPSSTTSVFAEWMFVQRKLTISSGLGAITASTWDENTSLATAGIDFDRCIRNYRGNTLAINVKGSIAFLDDHLGYDAEAALRYIIPIRRGRFGFIKGGYRYAQLKKERDADLFGTTMDGAFLQVGFLF